MTTEEFKKRVTDERHYQDYKWGKQDHSPEKWLAILTEELGEVAEAVNLGDTTGTRNELIQVAAVVEAWLTTGAANDN